MKTHQWPLREQPSTTRNRTSGLLGSKNQNSTALSPGKSVTTPP